VTNTSAVLNGTLPTQSKEHCVGSSTRTATEPLTALASPEVICIIPAKGESKRIPGKNLKPFLGTPVILHSIEIAKSLGFERIVVATDSDKIGGIAAHNGATYHKRSPETCAYDSPMIDVVLEVLKTGNNWECPTTVMLYPCSPFTEAMDIKMGLDILRWSSNDVVFPVYEAREAPERSMIKVGNYIVPRHPEWSNTNSDDFTQTYHSAGQWYVANTSFLMAYHTFTPLECGYIEIPQSRAMDIDTPADWDIAEVLMLMRKWPELKQTLTYHVDKLREDIHDAIKARADGYDLK